MKALNYIEIAKALENNDKLESLSSDEATVFADIWATSAQFDYENKNQIAAKNRLMEAIEPQNTKHFQIPRIWYAAASFLLVSIVTLAFFLQNSVKIYTANVGERLEIELKDHTKVILQGGSQLTVEKYFNNDVRNVALNGTAFFKVAKNKNLPFVITTSKAEVTVLGTAFLVQARKTSNYFQVSVKEGKVAVKTPAESVVLEKGMSTYMDELSKRLMIQDLTGVDPSNEAVICFVNANLSDVLEEVGQRYGVKFTYDQSFSNTKITLKTKSNSAEEIASILAETIGSGITVYK